jgi:hypothetical protein
MCVGVLPHVPTQRPTSAPTARPTLVPRPTSMPGPAPTQPVEEDDEHVSDDDEEDIHGIHHRSMFLGLVLQSSRVFRALVEVLAVTSCIDIVTILLIRFTCSCGFFRVVHLPLRLSVLVCCVCVCLRRGDSLCRPCLSISLNRFPVLDDLLSNHCIWTSTFPLQFTCVSFVCSVSPCFAQFCFVRCSAFRDISQLH